MKGQIPVPMIDRDATRRMGQFLESTINGVKPKHMQLFNFIVSRSYSNEGKQQGVCWFKQDLDTYLEKNSFR